MSGPVDGGTQRAAAMMNGMMAGLSRAEQLMAGGALLALVGGDWIFGSLLGGGSLAPWVLVAATELLLAIWVKTRKPKVAWAVSYGLIVSALVVAIVTTEFSDLLFALFQGGLNGVDAEQLLTDLCSWGGAVLMGLGAWEYWRSGGA